jgi:hypothetical protein
MRSITSAASRGSVASYKELPAYAETKKRIEDALARGERPRM